MIELNEPLLGRLTQGAIFSCAKAERYPESPCFGLVITARCDLAQDKFPVLNYVPVVRLADWLVVDGLDILRDRIANDLQARLENQLRNHDIPLSLLNSQSYRDILNKVFNAPNSGKEIKKAAPKFEQTVELHEKFEHVSSSVEASCQLVESQFPAFKSNLIRELVRGSVMGYYFLPRTMHNEVPTGYVALLREVSSLPRELAWLIARGAEEKDIFSSKFRNQLSFRCDDFSMPIGEVPSPQIEHILQVFSSLFARIGLTDYDQKFTADICALPMGS